MRIPLEASIIAAFVLCAGAHAEAQAAAPTSRLDAMIALPGDGPTRYSNVHAEQVGDRLALVGCVSSAMGVCFHTSRVVLDTARSRELTDLLAAMEARMRCPPPAAQPGDPTFTITTRGPSGGTFEGSLPRDAAQVASRTTGSCAATPRLAWFLVQWFGVPGLTAPQG